LRFALSSGRWTYGGRFYLGSIRYGLANGVLDQSGTSLFRSQFDFEWRVRPWLELNLDIMLGQHFYPSLSASGTAIAIRRALLPGLLAGVTWRPIRIGAFAARVGLKGGALGPLPAGDVDQLQTGVAAAGEASVSYTFNRRWRADLGGKLEMFRQSTQAVRFQILDLIFQAGVQVSLDTAD
jgi:hypothetical protein